MKIVTFLLLYHLVDNIMTIFKIEEQIHRSDLYI